jgi:integrase/recombinase XerD
VTVIKVKNKTASELNGNHSILKAYLEPEEVLRLEKSATCMRDRLLVRISYHLGCRVSESLALKVEDIDFKKSTVTILHLKSRINLGCPECGARLGKKHTFCSRCGLKVEEVVTKEKEHRKMRTLPVDENTLELLKEYIRLGGPVQIGSQKLIFGISRHRAWQIIKECAEKARLPKLINPETGKVHNVSPHRLRDAFATHAVKQDDSADSLRLLQVHLGHSSFDTTARYRKVNGEEHLAWYQNLWRNEVNSNHDVGQTL